MYKAHIYIYMHLHICINATPPTCCNVLQCVAVCCSVLQHVAVSRSESHCITLFLQSNSHVRVLPLCFTPPLPLPPLLLLLLLLNSPCLLVSTMTLCPPLPNKQLSTVSLPDSTLLHFTSPSQSERMGSRRHTLLELLCFNHGVHTEDASQGGVLQCVAVCGSVWQCVAVCCSESLVHTDDAS